MIKNFDASTLSKKPFTEREHIDPWAGEGISILSTDNEDNDKMELR